MFKFIKELISSVKEGIDEAKEEIKKEDLAEQNKTSINNKIDSYNEYEGALKQIGKITYTEKFGTALSAPFRVVIFGDWFTLFKSDKEDLTTPLHLYKFGEYPKLEEKKNEFSSLLKRDFAITDKESCLKLLKTFFELANIDFTETILFQSENEKIDKSMWDMSKAGSSALLSSVSSHIIASSTDVGFLDKEQALDLLKRIIKYTKENYNSWEEFAENFIVGERNVGLNNSVGKKYLLKYIKYLKEKKGSPWNNIKWQEN